MFSKRRAKRCNFFMVLVVRHLTQITCYGIFDDNSRSFFLLLHLTMSYICNSELHQIRTSETGKKGFDFHF